MSQELTNGVEVGDLVVHFDRPIVTMSGREVSLTQNEFILLRFLAQHVGQIMSTRQILDFMYGSSPVAENIVSQTIRRLRKKLTPSDPGRYITTLPREGYRLAAPA